jgi:hypothetical protein
MPEIEKQDLTSHEATANNATVPCGFMLAGHSHVCNTSHEDPRGKKNPGGPTDSQKPGGPIFLKTLSLSAMRKKDTIYYWQ